MQVEWLILADAAQVSQGKLFLLGGGWDVLNVNQVFPYSQQIGLAVSFRVAWNETNEKHNVEVQVETEDGTELAKIGAQLEVGRPPGIPVGTEQRAQIAANFPIRFDKPGVFAVVARIEGQDTSRTVFRVVGGKAIQAPPTP